MHGVSHAATRSKAVADVPIYRPVPFLEGQPEHFTLEEQWQRLSDALRLQLARHCFFKPPPTRPSLSLSHSEALLPDPRPSRSTRLSGRRPPARSRPPRSTLSLPTVEHVSKQQLANLPRSTRSPYTRRTMSNADPQPPAPDASSSPDRSRSQRDGSAGRISATASRRRAGQRPDSGR